MVTIRAICLYLFNCMFDEPHSQLWLWLPKRRDYALSWLKFGVCVEPLTKPSDCLSESASFTETLNYKGTTDKACPNLGLLLHSCRLQTMGSVNPSWIVLLKQLQISSNYQVRQRNSSHHRTSANLLDMTPAQKIALACHGHS